MTKLILSNDFSYCEELVAAVKENFLEHLALQFEEIAASFK